MMARQLRIAWALLMVLGLGVTTARAELRWWVLHPLASFSPDTPAAEPGRKLVDLQAARGEAESVIIALRNDLPTFNVRLEPRELTSGEHRIAVEQIQWRLVGYTHSPSEEQKDGQKLPAWPDVLLPRASFKLEPKLTHALHVTVTIPADAKPGTYRSQWLLRADRQPDRVVLVTLTVYDVLVPPGPGLARSSFGLIAGRRDWKPGEYRQYADLLLAHRVNPDDSQRTTPPSVADLEQALAQGMNTYTICNITRDVPTDRVRQFLKDLAASPQADTLRGMGMFYGFADALPDDFPAMKKSLARTAADFPDVPRLSTARLYMGWTDPVAVMKEYHLNRIGLWSSAELTYFRPEHTKALRDAGYEPWLFHSQLQNRTDPLRSRLLWWQVFQQQAAGWIYSHVNGWNRRTPVIDPATTGVIINYAPNAYAQAELVYPGTQGPLATLRLANIRDGVEDYHLLTMLAQKQGFEEAAKMAGYVTTDMLSWNNNAQALFLTRKAILTALTR